MTMLFTHRAAYAKFRCGVAPLKIKTERYSGNLLTLEFAHSVQTLLRTNNMLSFTAQRMIR